ncbi:FecR domain-containing protein [Phenylobacterium ferrooxidans]|uniref:FecR domain-containing protein n=1 Tax=Phenylobacterium ferrooxidans TaxID=2982689 RepID=A0ABW6CU63_9CAUL
MKLPALLLALALPTAALAQQGPPPSPPDARYVVKKGDNLYTLGTRYFARPGDYRTVQRLNRIPDARRLRPGSTVVVPYRVMRTNAITAELVAFSGGVQIEQGGRAITPRVGLPIVEGMRLTTLAGGFLTIELSDESRITLPSNSSGRVRQLREVPMTGGMLRVFDLDQGRSSTSATPNANPDSRFLIRTPLSVSAVRGTEFRVAALSDGQATTEVLKGLVGVAGTSAEVAVAETFGVSVSPTSVGEPIKLPPTPKLARGGRAQEDPVVAFAVEPVAGAVAYRLQLANDAGFVDTFAETTTDQTAVTFAGVPDGTYFVRVTALDAIGLEGLASNYGFDRDLNVLEPGQAAVDRSGKLRKYLFKWTATGQGVRTYRFQMFADPQARTALVDQTGLEAPQVVLTDLPPGTYYWRVTATRLAKGQITEKVGGLQDLTVGQ